MKYYEVDAVVYRSPNGDLAYKIQRESKNPIESIKETAISMLEDIVLGSYPINVQNKIVAPVPENFEGIALLHIGLYEKGDPIIIFKTNVKVK